MPDFNISPAVSIRKVNYLCNPVRKAIAVILFTLFNLGAFGVTIEQHLCCHSQQEESNNNHCSDDESCCDENEGCCDEVVSQIKIAKDYNASAFKLSIATDVFLLPMGVKFYSTFVADKEENPFAYATLCYFPPPQDLQVLFSSFLI